MSSPAIEQGATYKVYLGGTSTGTVTDTLYSGGDLHSAVPRRSLTIEGVVTTSGSAGSGAARRAAASSPVAGCPAAERRPAVPRDRTRGDEAR